MAESRDRLTRTVDIAEVFARRRSGPWGIYTDEARELFGSPVRQPVTHRPMGVGVATSTMRGGGLRTGIGFATPRSGNRRVSNLNRSAALRRENTPTTTFTAMGRGRGGATGSMLPSWYPRTPLRDITGILRAIERRRARLGEGEGLANESPVSQNERVLNNPNASSGAQLEHIVSTPASTARLKPSLPSAHKVAKILLDVTTKKAEESEFLTPQKKLLDSIDIVEKAVMEELHKLKRTPSAKKTERQKKVRTLMSMR
ncbi:hypothetical protein PTKIN_Ptkin13bG0220200 [Pterospermum kingtungense]